MHTIETNSGQIWIHDPAGAGSKPVIWLLAGEMTQKRLQLVLDELPDDLPPFVLAGFGPVNWNHDYAPWRLDTPDGRHFGDGADALIDRALAQVLPAVRAQTGAAGPLYAAGYSLGGLAALYAAGRTNAFAGVGSCSGSLWYPDFIPWLQTHLPSCPVYLSLGGKEKNTRDPLMAQVECKTQEAYNLLRSVNPTVFVHEPGGHFSAPEARMAHAICWLLTPRRSGKPALPCGSVPWEASPTRR